MNPWGISGPQFLLLYAALFAVTLVGVVLARRRVLASGDRAAVPAHLDPYQAAYLNGGGDLAVPNAASNLLRRGSLANAGRPSGRVGSVPAGGRPPRTGGSRTSRARSPRRRRWPRSVSGCAWTGWRPPPSSGPGTGSWGCGSRPCWPSG